MTEERIDLDAADAPWLKNVVRRIEAARQAGDMDEVDRLLEYARAEGSLALVRMLEQILGALQARDTAAVLGEDIAPFAITPGRRAVLRLPLGARVDGLGRQRALTARPPRCSAACTGGAP